MVIDWNSQFKVLIVAIRLHNLYLFYFYFRGIGLNKEVLEDVVDDSEVSDDNQMPLSACANWKNIISLFIPFLLFY